MADPTGASTTGAPRSATTEAAGSLISIATTVVLLRTYSKQIKEGFDDVRGVATDIAHWIRIQWGHNLVAFQRGMAFWAALLLTALHLIAMKIVSLEFNALGRPIPSGMWSLWGWLVGIVFVLYALGIARAFPVRPIKELTDADRALSPKEFEKKFGPHNRSPFFLGLWFMGITILSGFTFYIPYSWLAWEHGDGIVYRLCYLHAIWLPLLGLLVGVAIPFAVVKAIEIVLGLTVGRVGGWAGNQVLTVFRGVATAFLPNVSGDDAEQKIKGDVAAELARFGEGMTKIWTDLLALDLVVGVWWMAISFFLSPLGIAPAAVISAIFSILRGKYRLGTLFRDQRRLLLNEWIVGLVYVIGVALHAYKWFHGLWIAVLVKFASMGTLVFLVLASIAAALFALCLFLWVKQHRTFKEEQKAALTKVPPEAIEKSTFLYVSMVATMVLGLFLLCFSYSGYCLWTGDYTVEVMNGVAKPQTTGVTTRSRRPGELEVNWKRIPGAVAYRVEVLKERDGGLEKVYQALPNETAATFDGLKPLQKYYTQVITVGRLEESHPAMSAPIRIMATDLTPVKATKKKKRPAASAGGVVAVCSNTSNSCCCELTDELCRDMKPECFP